MTETVREVERKYDVEPSFRLPDLGSLPGVRTVDPPQEQELSATYFDTADRRLAAHSLTLRRRTGGTDAGWHLKLPAPGGARDEVRHPLGPSTRTVPAALRRPVEMYLRGATLRPVAQLVTRRTVHRLRGADGAVLAEVADDRVTATDLAGDDGAAVSVWREVEVELAGGGDRLLAAAGEALRAAGAVPSPARSKLARAVGDRLPARDPEPDLPPGSAGAVVLAHLREQVATLQGWDPRVRADEHDAVHQMRVTTRRLRSALATFRPLFGRSATKPVRAELRWLGGVLGAVRDAEVVRQRLLSAVRAEPAELVLGPVAQRVQATFAAQHRDAMAEAHAALSTDRYFRLLDALDALLAAPPLTDRATKPARKVLRKRVRAAWRRVRRAAGAVPAADDRDRALHEVRKATKRARYAAESVRPVFGAPARRFARRMKSVQQLLGEHQDTVVCRAALRRLGVQAHRAGEHGFSFGRLHGLEQARADRAADRYPEVWHAAAANRCRRWMKS
jgi:CHAD domain-containing protein